MTCLQIVSPGKINLFLYVTGKRSDGYHELVSLMVPLGITDRLSMELDQCQGIQVNCQYPGVPCDHSNLACRAAWLFLEQYGKKTGCFPVKGIRINIDKQIPPGGGLGGGSSNAASVLLALNRYVPFAFSLDELSDMGMSLGADVPFFLRESAAMIQGAGEKVVPVSFSVPDWYVLICHPCMAASTAIVFKKYDFYLTHEEKCYTIADPISLVDSLDLSTGTGLHNDLEKAAFALYPEIQGIRDQLEVILKKKVSMSGTGSCLFALYSSYEDAEQGYKRLEKGFPKKQAQFFLTSFYNV